MLQRNREVLVAIVGDKFGTESQVSPGSISQNELRRALELKTQTHVFVLEDVVQSYGFWTKNKSIETVEYGCDVKILGFLDEIYALTTTGVETFRTATDITNILREQWAGLFQALLSQRLQVAHQAATNKIGEVAEELKNALNALRDDRWSAQCIGHPLGQQLRKLLSIEHRVYVRHVHELEDWLRNIGFTAGESEGDFDLWQRRGTSLRVRTAAIFTEKGLLKLPLDWDDGNLVVETVPVESEGYGLDDYNRDDDLSF